MSARWLDYGAKWFPWVVLAVLFWRILRGRKRLSSSDKIGNKKESKPR